MSIFKKAVKSDAKLRMAITGPSGSGKTYSALAIASALVPNAKIAVVDTENGSAAKYADQFDFDVAEMHAPFAPAKYVQAIQAAEEAGYDVIILDSLSHAWSGTGGVIDIVDNAAKRMKNPNTYMAWKEGTPEHNRLIDGIVQSRIHVIGTMRAKTEYIVDDRNRPRKVGMAPVQRDQFEYEFDIVFDMDVENNAIVSKTRCPALANQVFPKPGVDVAGIIANWLRGDGKPEPKPKPQAAKRPQPEPDHPFEDDGDRDVDFGMGGKGEPEPEPDKPTNDELEVLSTWQTPDDARQWAVDVGACDNIHEAKNSFAKIVDDHGGRLTKSNVGAVYLAFLRRQNEKLAELQPA